MIPSFHVTREELELVSKIAKRALKMYDHMLPLHEITQCEIMMDLEACHANGCPLKFDELLHADDVNFAHDIGGIRRHINRQTGRLEDCFWPRFAQ